MLTLTSPKHTTPTITPFDFVLPTSLEAHEPPEARGLGRDEVRMLVSDRRDDRIEHARFTDLPQFLERGDLVVVNDSATLPAALTAMREDGSELPLHLSTQIDDQIWVVEPRNVTVDAGERFALPEGGTVEILARHHRSPRLWRARLELPAPVLPYLEKHGRPITYSYVEGDWPIEMYQTYYASKPGSSEMASAGRAFSRPVIDGLAAGGVKMSAITLHTGVASLEDYEPPYEEWFHVPAETARSIAETKASGGRVIAVGTTVVRALESATEDTGAVMPTRGWTDLVVTPERGVHTVDAMLTGFHEPKASHLSMLEAIASRDHLSATYAAALAEGYLWHEFGDVHLIL